MGLNEILLGCLVRARTGIHILHTHASIAFSSNMEWLSNRDCSLVFCVLIVTFIFVGNHYTFEVNGFYSRRRNNESNVFC